MPSTSSANPKAAVRNVIHWMAVKWISHAIGSGNLGELVAQGTELPEDRLDYRVIGAARGGVDIPVVTDDMADQFLGVRVGRYGHGGPGVARNCLAVGCEP